MSAVKTCRWKRGTAAALPVEFISNLYQAGDKKVIQCDIRDITERRRAEKKMRSMQDRLEADQPRPDEEM